MVSGPRPLPRSLRPSSATPPPGCRWSCASAAIAALVLPDIEVAREWDGHPPGTSEVDFDADLKHYARKDEKGNVSVRRVVDDVEIARVEGLGPVGWPAIALSPNGRFLAQQGAPNPNGRLKLWRRTGHNRLSCSKTQQPATIWPAHLHPGGRPTTGNRAAGLQHPVVRHGHRLSDETMARERTG